MSAGLSCEVLVEIAAEAKVKGWPAWASLNSVRWSQGPLDGAWLPRGQQQKLESQSRKAGSGPGIALLA